MFGESLFDICISAINSWKPVRHLDESGYKKDLRLFLFKKLNKPKTNAFGRNEINVSEEGSKSLCDIAVNRSLGIELKFGKDGKIKKQKINTSKNQELEYRKEYSQGIIVVLVGDVDNHSVTEVESQLNDLSNLINIHIAPSRYLISCINKSHKK